MSISASYGVCLFDLDGTLTDSKEGIVNSFKYALSKYGVDLPEREINKILGPALRDSFKNIFGFSENQAEEATAFYREYFSETGIYENKTYPGVISMLKSLKENGITLAVATSKTSAYSERILKHFDLFGYFSFISGSEFDGRRSDKKELILYALENTKNLNNGRSVMIGDRKYDMAGAKQAGINCIGAIYGYGTRAELESAGADYIARSPEEITSIVLGK